MTPLPQPDLAYLARWAEMLERVADNPGEFTTVREICAEKANHLRRAIAALSSSQSYVRWCVCGSERAPVDDKYCRDCGQPRRVQLEATS